MIAPSAVDLLNSAETHLTTSRDSAAHSGDSKDSTYIFEANKKLSEELSDDGSLCYDAETDRKIPEIRILRHNYRVRFRWLITQVSA